MENDRNQEKAGVGEVKEILLSQMKLLQEESVNCQKVAFLEREKKCEALAALSHAMTEISDVFVRHLTWFG